MQNKEKDNGNKSITRRITFQYLFVLGILAILTCIDFLLFEYKTNLNGATGTVINVSGRQRMLSQRTGALAYLLVNARDQTAQNALRTELLKEIQLMESSHHGLIFGDTEMNLLPISSPQVETIYFDMPTNLNKQVVDYLKNLKALVSEPDNKLTVDNPHLNNIQAVLSKGELLETLDKVVAQYEKENSRHMTHLENLKIYQLILTILVLLLTGWFLFRPIVSRIKKQFIDLSIKNELLRQEIINRQQVENELCDAMEQAETASRAKTHFLANMSHEIRTPLNAIVGFSEILMEEVKGFSFPTDIVDYAKDIASSGRKLCEVIEDILDLAKIEAGKIEIVEKEMNLKLLIQSIYHVNKIQALTKKLQYTYYLDSGLPVAIHSDRNKLNQILTNLISNAIKFTPEGKSVELRAIKEDSYLILQVIDQGIGIPEDKLSAIFQSFEQVDGSISKKFGGTGLGLAITKNLTELLGGNIWVESTLGEGSVFTVKLPLIGISSKAVSSKEIIYQNLHFSRDNQILIIEDEPVNQKMIKILFHKMGLEIHLANNAQEGIEKVQQLIAEGHPPDLILMDLHLPEMDGFEAAGRIHFLSKDTNIPIVALSADAFTEQQLKAQAVGMKDYLVKPVDISKLVAVLKKYLR